METIQKTSKILIFADINGRVAQLVSNGWSVPINGTGLQLPVLKQVQQEVSYGFQRWCPEVHLITEAPLCKNGPLCLIDRSGWSLWGASIRAATASEKPCSLIAVALGARQVGSGLTSSCAGSGWKVEIPGWADTEGSDWTLPLDPRTRACWATLGQSEWSCCMGSPATSPPICPRWLLVWKAYGSRFSHDRLSASTAHAWESGTGDTNCGSLLLNLVANTSICGWCYREHIALNTSGWRDHSVWMVWPSLDSLSAITFSRPGMWRALMGYLFPGAPGQDSPQ